MIRPDLVDFKATYESAGCVQVPQIFSEKLMQTVEKAFEETFTFKEYPGFAWTEYVLGKGPTESRLNLIFNSDQVVEEFQKFLTDRIKTVVVRVYYHNSETSGQTWHDDTNDPRERFAAVRVEFSRGPYGGGAFIFRDTSTEKIQTFPRQDFGDAVFFQVVEDRYHHMVESVTTGTRRSLILFFCRK